MTTATELAILIARRRAFAAKRLRLRRRDLRRLEDAACEFFPVPVPPYAPLDREARANLARLIADIQDHATDCGLRVEIEPHSHTLRLIPSTKAPELIRIVAADGSVCEVTW